MMKAAYRSHLAETCESNCGLFMRQNLTQGKLERNQRRNGPAIVSWELLFELKT